MIGSCLLLMELIISTILTEKLIEEDRRQRQLQRQCGEEKVEQQGKTDKVECGDDYKTAEKTAATKTE